MKAISEDSDGNEIKVKVNCACCGSSVKESKIEQVEENASQAEEEEEEDNEIAERAAAAAAAAAAAPNTADGKRETPTKDLLRSQSSSSTGLSECFSCCCKRSSEKDKRMADKAVYVHTTSASSKNLSIA